MRALEQATSIEPHNLKYVVGAAVGIVVSVGAFISGLFGNAGANTVNVTIEDPKVHVSDSIQCPPDWTRNVAVAEDAVVLSCSYPTTDVLVYLNPDGSFSHAWDGTSTAFVNDPAQVPHWPQ